MFKIKDSLFSFNELTEFYKKEFLETYFKLKEISDQKPLKFIGFDYEKEKSKPIEIEAKVYYDNLEELCEFKIIKQRKIKDNIPFEIHKNFKLSLID